MIFAREKMTGRQRTAMAVALVLAAAAFLFPLWEISLSSPQYPEGLTMEIWINKIAGQVAQVNILNHYIGMKKIEPGMFPELAIMPKALAGLLLAGALVVIFRGRRWAQAWLALFILAGAVGLYDFFLWGYAYGHDLNPDAPIKIENMTYQPPLIGTKTILNITASSWPGLGGILILLSVGLTGFAACTAAGPQAIEFGVDHCEHCKMTITDGKFAAEIQTTKGRVLKFDSIACLLAYYKANHPKAGKIWVADFLHPGDMMKAEAAVFTTFPRGPMGPTPVAARRSDDLQPLAGKEGRLMSWPDVLGER
jgi:copper chaperone NosL